MSNSLLGISNKKADKSKKEIVVNGRLLIGMVTIGSFLNFDIEMAPHKSYSKCCGHNGWFVYGDTDWFIWHVWLLGQESSNQI